MGADGTWAILPAERFRALWPGVDPTECDLYTATVLGVECLTTYWDTDGRGEPWGKLAAAEAVERLHDDLKRAEDEGGQFERNNYWSSTPSVITAAGCRDALKSFAEKHDFAELARLLEACRWFDANAERHTVWT